jgi:TatD DNase family protein
MFDSHAHLNDSRFAPDRPEVIARAREAGVAGMIVVGYDLPSSQVALKLAAEEPDIWSAVGVHPHDAADVTPAVLDSLRQLAGHERVVAIGESGLDYFRNLSPPPVQRQAFAEFIRLARELSLPLIVHCREAQEDCLRVLDEERDPGQTVIMHCFAGGMEFARQCLERGFYLGLAGTITYPKAFALRKLAAEGPLERLLIETDCPYLPPQAHRGQRNEPAYVRYVAETVAKARGVGIAEIARQTAANARQAFRLDQGVSC